MPINPFPYLQSPYTNLNPLSYPGINQTFRNSGFPPSALFPILPHVPPFLSLPQTSQDKFRISQRLNPVSAVPQIPIRHSISSQGSHSSSTDESNNLNASPTESLPGRKKRR